MEYSEIGSEFWESLYYEDEKQNSVVLDGKKRGFLCGRAALDYIIRDAKVENNFQNILLPSYCCHTMIEPFIINEVGVRFYSVVPSADGLKCILPEPEEHEAVYIMEYFGFENKIEGLKEEIGKWDFAILDKTHSCFRNSEEDYASWNVKYIYTSYRKWADIPGFGLAEKMDQDFILPQPNVQRHDYLEVKKQACQKKKKYIDRGEGDKTEFLHLYQQAEELLESDYKDTSALEEGIWSYKKLDIEKIRKKRQENAGFLIEKLRGKEGIQLVFPQLSADDCPLHVPILVQDGQRNALRKYLIEKAIYCPVHWPISEYHQLKDEGERLLYDGELSLICDQRYGIREMKKIVDCIDEFLVHSCDDKKYTGGM